MSKWEIRANKAVSVLVFILAIAGATLVLYGLYEMHFGKKEKPVVMTQEEATDAKTVEKKAAVSPAESRIISREIERSADTPPVVTYYVQAPTLEKAATETAKAIETQSPALPPAAAKKSDRTIVTADNKLNKVDVYKISLRRAHKLKAGMTYVNDKSYLSAGYQAGRWEGLAYFDWQGKPKGGSLLYTVHEW